MRTAFFSSIAAIAVSFASPALAQEKTLTVYTYDSFVAEWGPGPAIAAKWWPNTTQRLVGTKSRPSLNRSAGVARVASMPSTRSAIHLL